MLLTSLDVVVCGFTGASHICRGLCFASVNTRLSSGEPVVICVIVRGTLHAQKHSFHTSQAHATRAAYGCGGQPRRNISTCLRNCSRSIPQFTSGPTMAATSLYSATRLHSAGRVMALKATFVPGNDGGGWPTSANSTCGLAPSSCRGTCPSPATLFGTAMRASILLWG
jgi:hypothetical protein